MPFYGYMESYDALHSTGMEIMPHAYIIIIDSSAVQQRNTDMFPQNACQFAMVVHQPSMSKKKDC